MTAGDWAAWAQALGSFVGIGIAIYVPFRIHARERRERRQARDSYRRLLRDAFAAVHEPIAYLATLTKEGYQQIDGIPRFTEETAAQLAQAVATMRDALNVVNEIEDVHKLDRFEAVLGILALRRLMKEAMPTFEKEFNWLQSHPSSDAVVDSAFNTLTHKAADLSPMIARVVKALSTDTSD